MQQNYHYERFFVVLFCFIWGIAETHTNTEKHKRIAATEAFRCAHFKQVIFQSKQTTKSQNKQENK